MEEKDGFPVPASAQGLAAAELKQLARQMGCSEEEAWNHLMEARETLSLTQTLNELFQGDWCDRPDAAEQLERFDLAQRFRGVQINPLFGAEHFLEMLDERFPVISAGAFPEELEEGKKGESD